MQIIKVGDISKAKKGEFHFICKKCGCEWYADRGDKGLIIAPPCCEFSVDMKCPTCNTYVTTR